MFRQRDNLVKSKQAVATFNKDDEVIATLPWSEYGDAFKITGRAEDAAARWLTGHPGPEKDGE